MIRFPIGHGSGGVVSVQLTKKLLTSAWNPGHQASTLVTILCHPGSLRNMQFQSNFNPCEYLCYRIILLYYVLLLLWLKY